MAKKSKNSKLLVHYTRTMTPENLSRAANYVGGYVLKGLGALGKIFTAPLTGGPLGPATVVLPKTKKLLDAERKLRLTQEELIGKAMTWVSPLNYGAALMTGNGLNAKKGEEEVASWAPAWQAVGRLGELYVGPKAVKGVKSAPRVVVNTAAKAGSKTAKKAVVAREIKLNVKNTLPELSNRTVSVNRDVNAFTGKPDLTYTLYNEFGEPIGQTNIGSAAMGLIERKGSRSLDRMVDGIYSKNKAHKVSEDTYNVAVLDVIDNGGTGIESGWSLMSPLKTLAVTSKFPNTVIGLEFGNPVRLLTGRSSRPMPLKVLGNHYLEIKPKTEIKFNEATGEFEEVPTTLSRLISLDTYPLYRGPLFSIKSIVNSDGTVNPRQAMKVLHTIADWFGNKAHRMESRLENPEWHKTDPTTFHHTKLVAQSAWRIPTPLGFTKYDQMVAALGHDFGKIVSGDGHAQIGADLAKLIFPDMTEALYKAIAEHMGVPVTSLGKATKMADMRNGIVVRDINGKTRILLPTHTDAKPREIVIDPQGDNKYYVHMRVWDDVGKHVPGNISDIEKGNLFQTLYESLPDNAEILFPKSGPGNYGTRGTVAGLQRLSRDPRFTPGTKGTLQYLDKDGKTIKTYEGTSFIKTPKLQYLKQGGKINAIEQFKQGGQIRKMQTAAGGPINYKRWDDAKITSYTIPYIKEKTIKLTNAGKAAGAKLSTNLLDSIADNAYRAGLPIRKGLGIAFKESTFGNPTDDKSAWNLSSKIRELFNNEYPGTYLHINNGHTVLGLHLINYHKGDVNHEIFYKGNPDSHKSIILEAFEFYKQHPDKYNPGLKNYQQLIDKRGNEAMQSPEILKWYKGWEKSKAQIFKPEPYLIAILWNSPEYKEQGGKMNILEFLKNGSGIHIKKKNRGKFTSYCGGTVTDECIRRGKNSSSATIRKRATFAANARKWKHKEGDIIKANAGTLLALNMGMNFLGQLPSIIGSSKKSNDNNTDSLNKLNLLIVADYQNNYDNIMSKLHDDPNNPNANGGSIVRNYIKYKLLAPMLFQQRLLLNNLKKLLDILTQLKKTDSLINMSSSLLLNGLGLLSNYNKSNKSSNSYTSSNPSYWDTYALNLSKGYGSVDNTGTMKLNSGTISLLNGYKSYSV